jgi:hypothetical protein
MMADFYPLLSSAVANLPENTAASRRAVYERVRDMLETQLRGTAEIDDARRSLEEAIARIEAAVDTPPRAAKPPPAAKAVRPARASGTKAMSIGIVAILVVACVLAGAYFAYTRLSSTGSAPLAAVPAGNDAIAINGLLADYRAAATKPADVLLLHVRCGATILERDAQSNPVNPSGHVDARGRFSITAQNAFLGEIIKVGVRANTALPEELHQDFLVLGFFAGEKLELLAGPDGRTIKISPQGRILNASALHIPSAVTPAMIVTRKADGNIYASGGAFTFDETC